MRSQTILAALGACVISATAAVFVERRMRTKREAEDPVDDDKTEKESTAEDKKKMEETRKLKQNIESDSDDYIEITGNSLENIDVHSFILVSTCASVYA